MQYLPQKKFAGKFSLKKVLESNSQMDQRVKKHANPTLYFDK